MAPTAGRTSSTESRTSPTERRTSPEERRTCPRERRTSPRERRGFGCNMGDAKYIRNSCVSNILATRGSASQ